MSELTSGDPLGQPPDKDPITGEKREPFMGGEPEAPAFAAAGPEAPPAPSGAGTGGYGSGPVPPGAVAGPPTPGGIPGAAAGPPTPGGIRGAAAPGLGQYELARFEQRAGAAVIDFLLKAVVAVVVLLIFGALGVGFLSDDSDSGVVAFVIGLAVAALAFAIASLLYEPMWMARTNGKTIGKQLTGCRVVRTSGEPMTFGWAFLREVLVKWLLIGTIANSFTVGLATVVDNLWPLWDAENRALHDFAVQTRVIQG